MINRGGWKGWRTAAIGPDGKLMAAPADQPVESKYHNIPTVEDGIRFASKAERNYYLRLKVRVASGEVAWFIRQVPFHLPGKTKYVADFLEVLADGRIRVVDVKGRETQMFKLKRRQVEALYPVRIELEKGGR